jgi:hypothetical protein
MHRSGAAFLLLVFIVALGACSASPHHRAPAASTRPGPAGAARPAPDLRTAAALVRIAQVFNDDYDRNNDGPVWDRWDARSQAVITRAEYIRRHRECATAPQGPAHVTSAMPGPHGAWLVHYEISGQQLRHLGSLGVDVLPDFLGLHARSPVAELSTHRPGIPGLPRCCRPGCPHRTGGGILPYT